MRNLLTVFFALCTLNTITVSARPAFDYSALRDGTFEQKTVSGVRSLSDGERYTTMSDGRVLCFSYRTGEPAGVLFDASAAEPRIEFTDYVLSADERRLLLTTDVEPIYRHSFTAEYWIYDRQDGSLRRLSQGGPQQQAQFSPDGSRVAFVRGGNLFVADPAAGSERQLTFASGEHMVCLVINGKKLPHEKEFTERMREVGADSISLSFNMEKTNVILGTEIKNLYGPGYITDKIGNIEYRISPLSFYQVNPVQTERLYGTALEFADLNGGVNGESDENYTRVKQALLSLQKKI